MKKIAWLAVLVPAPLFLLLSGAGRAYPLLNAYPAECLISESMPSAEALPPNMIPVDGGRFRMGASPGSDPSADGHPVELASYSIARYETTFAQYDSFCVDTARPLPPDQGLGRGQRPVGCVSWYDAVEYCNWLSETHGLQPCYEINRSAVDPSNAGGYDLLKWRVECDFSASGYRLPTEAEWEYAAQGAGLSQGFLYSGSDAVSEVAWYFDNTGRYPQEVGLKKPNELGLYDMSGNVYEWTADWFSEDYSRCVELCTEPPELVVGTNRSVRGGSCFFDAQGATVIHRKTASPCCRLPYVGFRVVRRMNEP